MVEPLLIAQGNTPLYLLPQTANRRGLLAVRLADKSCAARSVFY
jgi:hypothetical protein